jgi:hypothetical protein
MAEVTRTPQESLGRAIRNPYIPEHERQNLIFPQLKES